MREREVLDKSTKAGLPVGIQIMGPYWEDATPITFAGLLAEELAVSQLGLAMKRNSDVNRVRERFIHKGLSQCDSRLEYQCSIFRYQNFGKEWSAILTHWTTEGLLVIRDLRHVASTFNFSSLITVER
jgi:hypothetical protein